MLVAMAAASAALTISGVPFMGPIAAARVGYIEGNTSSIRKWTKCPNPASTSSSPEPRMRC